jgi:prophage antirepressor-like protein
MDDQWIEARPIFCLEDFCHCLGLERVSREAVNGLRWQCDGFASLQKLNRARCGEGVSIQATVVHRRDDFRFHLA